MTLILTNEDIGQILTMEDLIPVLADAFVELGEGRGGDRVRTDIVTPTTWSDDGLYATTLIQMQVCGQIRKGKFSLKA